MGDGAIDFSLKDFYITLSDKNIEMSGAGDMSQRRGMRTCAVKILFVLLILVWLSVAASRQKTENWLVGECRPFSTENVVTNRRFRNNIEIS